jgi:NAD(P)H dehydrogenase (quinone)
MKILITGATGHLGSAVIETLIKQMPAQQISVLVRKEDKQIEMQTRGLQAYLGNYDDLNSLEKAMNGVDTVLLISSTDEGDRMQQHRNVVDTTKKIDVKNIAYTSRSLRDKDTLSNQLMLEHFDTEDYIKQSGLNYVIFRNALYMDVLPIFVGKQVFETGIFQPAGEGKIAFALRKEMGEAMANVLLEPHTSNKIYNFTGNKEYSFYEIASILTELSGKDVKYMSVDIPAFAEMMKGKGLPELMIGKIIRFNTDIKNGQEAIVTSDLEVKLGRKPASLKEGLKILFGL